MAANNVDKVTEDGDPKELPPMAEGGQLVDHRDGRDVVLRLRGAVPVTSSMQGIR